MAASPSAKSTAVQLLEIEPATWRDLLAIHQVGQASFGRDAWPWLDTLAALTSAGVRLKAMVGEHIVGYVIGDRRRQGVGWIASIAVHPDWRRQGIATRLLTEAETRLDTDRVRLTLRKSNEAARHLYIEHGYRDVDVWPGYYHDGEDGLVMEWRQSAING